MKSRVQCDRDLWVKQVHPASFKNANGAQIQLSTGKSSFLLKQICQWKRIDIYNYKSIRYTWQLFGIVPDNLIPEQPLENLAVIFSSCNNYLKVKPLAGDLSFA